MTEEQPSNTSELGMDVICRFAGHLAHELNNLLTPIIACGQMLKDGLEKDDPQFFCAEQIFEAGERCLGFSRKLQIIGSRRSNSQTVDLPSFVHEAAKSVTIPDDKDIRVELPTVEVTADGSEQFFVSIDTEQLMFLVSELLNNAISFMPNGGVIRVSVSGKDKIEGHEGEGWVCLTVRDEGTGMDQDVQVQMYEPYFSTVGNTRDKGLGLTLVYGIVRRAGGVILCESSPGEGTAFDICLPRITSAAEE